MGEIPISQVVARAKIQIKESSSDRDFDFEIYAEEAMQNLNCYSSYGREEVILDVVDGKAKLPCGYLSLLYAVPYDESGCCCSGDTIYVDTSILNRCECSTSSLLNPWRDCYTLFQIIRGYIHLNMPTDVTKIHLVYMGLPKNDQGLTIIDQRYEKTVYNYILYQDGMSIGTKLQRWQTEKFQQDWVAAQQELAGRDTAAQWRLTRQWIHATLLDKIRITPRL